MRGVRPQPTSTVTMGSETLASIPKQLTMGLAGTFALPTPLFCRVVRQRCPLRGRKSRKRTGKWLTIRHWREWQNSC